MCDTNDLVVFFCALNTFIYKTRFFHIFFTRLMKSHIYLEAILETRKLARIATYSSL